MRILELNFEKTWRGGERQTIYSLQGFADAGIDVALLCRKNTPLEKNAVAKGYKVYAFNTIFGVLFFLIFKGNRFDVLHAHTSQILTYCAFTKFFHRAKVVYTRRVAFVQKGILTKWKYRLTDIIVGISTAVKNNLQTFTGRQDVHIIPDAVVKKNIDTSKAFKLKEALTIPAGTHIIATIAAIDTEKDPMTMVEAIRLLYAKRKDFVFLHFGTGPLETELKQKIDKYGLQQLYLLPGFIDNIEDMFAIFEVFVMPSLQEGMGSSVLDAFVYKVPVVATDAGGLADLIHNGRGIMCRVQSPAMVADGIDLLLDQPALRERIVNNAFEHAMTQHSISHITQQYLSVLK
jgi:glycosyltransferase involved in cell wall biosynthesis